MEIDSKPTSKPLEFKNRAVYAEDSSEGERAEEMQVDQQNSQDVINPSRSKYDKHLAQVKQRE
jgi:hypothetical protein